MARSPCKNVAFSQFFLLKGGYLCLVLIIEVMELAKQPIEKKYTVPFPLKGMQHPNRTTWCHERLKSKLALVLWWSLYIQLLPGISFNLMRKMKKNIRIMHNSKGRPVLFQRHVFFGFMPGTFFSLLQVKETI